jgi:hypothetical protein
VEELELLEGQILYVRPSRTTVFSGTPMPQALT